ncbi:hypothetical protein Tco_0324862 [Tanacetum coccineum]
MSTEEGDWSRRSPEEGDWSWRSLKEGDWWWRLPEEGVKTTSHLFFTCEMAQQVSHLINLWWDVPDMEIDSYDSWKIWVGNIRLTSKTKMMFEGVYHVSWWLLWWYRNQKIFEAKTPNKALLFDDMALPRFKHNHSAFWSMFEKRKNFPGNNFNDWFARLKLVLRVEKKMHVIEQPLPPAPEAGVEPNIVAQWTALYDAHTEIACLMLGSMTPELHRQFELHYPYDMVQELRSMLAWTIVLKMKRYGGANLERLGYMLPKDILISNNGVLYFIAVSHNGIYEIDMHDLVPNVNFIYNVCNKKSHSINFGLHLSIALVLATINKKVFNSCNKDGLMFKSTVWGCEAFVKKDTPDKLQQRSVKCIFIGYPKETMGYYFYFLPENKIVVARYAEFFEKLLISQEISGRGVRFLKKEIQEATKIERYNTSEYH